METRSVFQDISAGAVAPAMDQLNKRATRFAFAPLWDITGLPSNAFKLQTLPGSRFLPLRAFPTPFTNEAGHLETRERLPSEQVIDLQNVAGEAFATEFLELAKLENEPQAREILELLTNPNRCSKYPIELENTCATCWVAFLRDDAPTRIVEKYSDFPQMYEAATVTLQKLLTSLESAVIEARRRVNVALREIDDPKSGKGNMFYPSDYINIYNTHQDRPKFKTTTDQNESMESMAKAIMTLAEGRKTDTGLTAADVQAMIDSAASVQLEAAAAEIAQLKTQLAAKEAVKVEAEPKTKEKA